MCFPAACHRRWLWLCWGGTEGDLATAHGGPGHSKSVSFGGDPSRLFKRVHYRLVNASAEGETLLTALNSPCTQSPSHSLAQAHTPIFFSLLHPLRCVSLAMCEDLPPPAHPVCLSRTRHTHLRLCLLSVNVLGPAFTESSTISQSLPISCIDVFSCGHVCSHGHV